MSIIYNGTTLSNYSHQIYNGTSLTSIIYNGTTVWSYTTQGTVTVNVNGGSGTNGTYTQDTGTTLNLGTPTRSGYNFGGWSLSGSGTLSGTTYTFGTSTATITASWTVAKSVYTWTHGDYATFYSELKGGWLNSVSYYTGGTGTWVDSSNYTSITGPNVLGDGTNSSTVYDVVYISGTSAILCMHNCSSSTATLSNAISAASSYRSGGYLPSLAQVGAWYCNNSGIAYAQTYSQLIKNRRSSSTTYWWTSSNYNGTGSYYINPSGNIGHVNNSTNYYWVCAFSV